MNYRHAGVSGVLNVENRIEANGQNVVALSRYQNEMKYPALKQIEAYWQGLRPGQQVPRRSDIDPRGIEAALEYAFILERIAPGLARFRIAGMHLNDLMGMEVRGMPFTTFFTPSARRAVSQVLESVFSGPEIAELSLKAERGIGKPAIDARVLLLPLRSDLGDVSRVLGCLASHGTIGRSPRRFDVTGMDMTNLASSEKSFVPVSGFAEPAPSFRLRGKDGANSKRPALRLIKSDD